jgi:hypothetical protein
LNAAIAQLVTQINNWVSRHLGASRRAMFDELERSAQIIAGEPTEPAEQSATCEGSRWLRVQQSKE